MLRIDLLLPSRWICCPPLSTSVHSATVVHLQTRRRLFKPWSMILLGTLLGFVSTRLFHRYISLISNIHRFLCSSGTVCIARCSRNGRATTPNYVNGHDSAVTVNRGLGRIRSWDSYSSSLFTLCHAGLSCSNGLFQSNAEATWSLRWHRTMHGPWRSSSSEPNRYHPWPWSERRSWAASFDELDCNVPHYLLPFLPWVTII